jgi:hypothetical protein
MLTLKHFDRVWSVLKDKTLVAEIRLDYCNQVDEVVLCADSSDEIQMQVLRLAASHVQQFVKNRTVPFGLMVAKYNNRDLTARDSYRLMDFGLIPAEIQKLDRDAILEGLGSLRVDVIVAVYQTAQEAIEDAVSRVGVPSLRYSLISQSMLFDNEVVLRLTVAKPSRFSFWRSEEVPTGRGWDLHVVPSYHPVMDGWKAVGMVNGATDAYISGRAVRSIYCPKAAQSDRHGRNFGSSWNHVKHPFYAFGRSMSIKLITTKMRSREGVEELIKLLRAALGQDKRYVEISGGFSAPMKCAHNRLLELNRPSPWPEAHRPRASHVARGSEEHCVWAYLTLKAEGTLDKSHVPDWFLKEGWLEIYEGAEVRPRIY